MAGDATKVKVWDSGDVLIFDPAVTLVPATHHPASIAAAWAVQWRYFGLMLGDPGMDYGRAFEEKSVSAWKYGKVKKRRRDFALTVKFSLLEDNAIVDEVLDPGSSATDIVVPKVARRFIAFQTVADDGTGERRISRVKADIWIPNDFKKEDPAAREVECDIYPDTNGSLFVRQIGTPVG